MEVAQGEDAQVLAFQSLKEASREREKEHIAPAQRRKAWERHQVGRGRPSGLLAQGSCNGGLGLAALRCPGVDRHRGVSPAGVTAA